MLESWMLESVAAEYRRRVWVVAVDSSGVEVDFYVILSETLAGHLQLPLCGGNV